MTEQQAEYDKKPWYRQFWPWVLIGIPAASVAGSMLMIQLALSGHDGVVREFYHKELRAVLENTGPDQLARDLGLSAEIRIDPTTGDVSLTLLGQAASATPDRLNLLLVHPTRSRQDQEIALQHLRSGHYAGQLTESLKGRRQVQLMPVDQRWRLKLERAYFPLQTPLQLHAATTAASGD